MSECRSLAGVISNGVWVNVFYPYQRFIHRTITTSQAKGTYDLARREVQRTISAEVEEEQCVAWKVRGGWECRVMSAFGSCSVSI